jgi:hypothetical protein
MTTLLSSSEATAGRAWYWPRGDPRFSMKLFAEAA